METVKPVSVPAHPLLFGQQLVARGDQEEAASSEEDAEERIGPGDPGDGEGAEKTDDDAGQANDIRDDLVIEIDEGDDHQGGGEEPQDRHKILRPETIDDQGEEEARQDLHQWIAQGYPHPAPGASPSQEKIAEDGNVLIPANGRPARRTARGGMDDRLAGRDAVDADVEEGADDGAEDEGSY